MFAVCIPSVTLSVPPERRTRAKQLRFHDCHSSGRHSATMQDASERIRLCLPIGSMLPVEGTETSVRRRFMSSYQAHKCAIVTLRIHFKRPVVCVVKRYVLAIPWTTRSF
jgi:hypothetical protein